VDEGGAAPPVLVVAAVEPPELVRALPVDALLHATMLKARTRQEAVSESRNWISGNVLIVTLLGQ
jgi:hypothetical protein